MKVNLIICKMSNEDTEDQTDLTKLEEASESYDSIMAAKSGCLQMKNTFPKRKQRTKASKTFTCHHCGEEFNKQKVIEVGKQTLIAPKQHTDAFLER